MKTVLIESPYAGDIDKNIDYAWKCVRDSCSRGEAPFASHLLYTVAVDKEKYAQETLGKSDDSHWISREEGLKRCEAWRKVADKTVFYIDLGYSSGMIRAKEHALQIGQEIEERTIL
jgi:hypothetical protein